jgi:hypothetical protein
MPIIIDLHEIRNSWENYREMGEVEFPGVPPIDSWIRVEDEWYLVYAICYLTTKKVDGTIAARPVLKVRKAAEVGR